MLIASNIIDKGASVFQKKVFRVKALKDIKNLCGSPTHRHCHSGQRQQIRLFVSSKKRHPFYMRKKDFLSDVNVP